MLNSVLWTTDPSIGGWRRYLVLMLDAISSAEPPRIAASGPDPNIPRARRTGRAVRVAPARLNFAAAGPRMRSVS
jgi:hypothetical protein